MGRRDLKHRLPKYVQAFVDRHGKARYYFRRAGYRSIALPGPPWSTEFIKIYQEALDGAPRAIGAKGVKTGSLRALATDWYASPGFMQLKPITRSTYRNIIDRFCRETDRAGQTFGEKSAAALQGVHIVKLMAARADKPDSANGLRKVLRALMKYAVEIGVRPDDPTQGVKAIRVKSDGYHSWTEDEIAAFEARHPTGTKARLAFDLLLYTSQRRGDVVRMGRQHVRDGALTVRQEKTGTVLTIPLHRDLEASIAAMPSDHLTLLTTQWGKPFQPACFGNWFRARCDEAGLKHCSAHGLRKAAARRLAESGCTASEIAAITGHASLREIVRYTKAADQKKLARAAMDKVKTGTSSVKPDALFDRKAKLP